MLERILGPSWKTSLAGYLTLLQAAFQQVIVEEGWPQTKQDWVTFIGKIIIALGLLSAKDGNVSNVPEELATSPKRIPAQIVEP
jgi:hypothetical protein